MSQETTYTELDAARKGIAFGVKEAKNDLVNEAKNIELCPEELKSPDIGPQEENPVPQKIDWEHVV